jgi:hypothetical protein
MRVRETSWAVYPPGEPLFSELVTAVRIDDEAAGEFVTVHQISIGKIRIDKHEWEHIRKVIDHAISCCEDEKAKIS